MTKIKQRYEGNGLATRIAYVTTALPKQIGADLREIASFAYERCTHEDFKESFETFGIGLVAKGASLTDTVMQGFEAFIKLVGGGWNVLKRDYQNLTQ